MYNNSPSINLATVLAGIVSLILIITFFVMAFRLRKIMEYQSKIAGITRAKAKKEGILEVWCPECSKISYLYSDNPQPIKCPCGKDITEEFNKKQSL
jgi:ribosomal protein S27E